MAAALKNISQDLSRRTMFSIAEIADRNCVSKGTVFRHIKLGLLKSTKIGARTVISRQQEAAWLANFNPAGGDGGVDAAFA